MATATFRFHGELDRFLAPGNRGRDVALRCARAATVKNAVEALGVPHTEIGRLILDGQPITLSRIVREGETIEVFPFQPGAAADDPCPRFLADAHLGGLARFLRMLGFDTLYDNAMEDAAIVETARREQRIVLTRDRELLKCRGVLRGSFVHAVKVEAQLREVAARYALVAHMCPFTLCLHCNLPLAPISAAEARPYVPEPILERYRQFVHCPGCKRVYWQGSHWERMRGVLADALQIQDTENIKNIAGRH